MPLGGLILDKTQAYLTVARLLPMMLILLYIAGIWVIPSGNLPLAMCWAIGS